MARWPPAGEHCFLPDRESQRQIVPLPAAGRVDRCWDVVPAAGVSTVLIRSLIVLPLAAGMFRQR